VAKVEHFLLSFFASLHTVLTGSSIFLLGGGCQISTSNITNVSSQIPVI